MLKQISVEPLSALNMMLPTFAAEHQYLWIGARSRPAAIDQYLLPQDTQQQTRWPPLLLSIDGTDGWTPDCYIDPVPHTMRAVGSVNNTTIQRTLDVCVT